MATAGMTDMVSEFSIDKLSTTEWHDKGLRSFLRYRDLGATKATGGRMRAEHIKAVGTADRVTGWHCHDLDFQFVYVLKGFVAFSAENCGDVVLKAGDCAHIPPFTMHDETEFSSDFEVLEITLPAEVATLTEKPANRGKRPDTNMVVSHLGEGSFKRGQGPRKFLEYRDFGLGEATGGMVQAQVVRTNGPCDASTGWHYHELNIQFVYVLNGWVKTELAGLGEFEMKTGDAMLIPSKHQHDVTGFSEDFEVFEINVPAEFKTIAV